ncbi:MAG: translation initiation factor IF-2 [Kiritimatiellae bacterium]|nr:translation initiation factor IF-2 [Kiritimatiellia bacterium]
MRVYELARETGVTSADILVKAAEMGYDAASAISVLEDSQAAELKKLVAPSAATEENRAAKKKRAAELLKAGADEEKKRLAAHLAAAKAAHEGRALPSQTQDAPAQKPKASASVEEPRRQPLREVSRDEVVSVLRTKVKEPVKKPVPDKTSEQKKSPVLPSGVKVSVGLTSAGFKPLAHAKKPTVGIKITVAEKSKAPISAPAAAKTGQPRGDYDEDERSSRKNKKDKDALKAFEKSQKRFSQIPARHETPSGRISVNEQSREISIRGAVVVKDLAAKLDIKPNRLIADLMALKVLASINQRVEPDIATKIAEKYGFKVIIEHARDKAAAKPVLKAIDADDLIPEDPPETLKPRAPVVTFLGHVDHGKTTLMDYIRKEHVAAGEAGGITQQISAYQVDVAGRKITFLDTPGHAAFSAMRARGAQLTDIAVLIIAADDGIMPQTEECIKVARQAGVQIMVAITKADKPTANIDRVKQQLQKEGLTPEDWGGDIICCPVSGVTGAGVDTLLENILVQAEVLELTANPARRANGYVIESELQQGLGPCATLLVTGGTLKVGDAILVGEHFGKVRALIDDRLRRVKEAGPAMPVKCTGLSGVPEAGAEFRVMLDEKRARTLAAQTAEERKREELVSSKALSLDALMSRMAAEGRRELNVIVKSDTQGSLEAIVEALGQIKSQKVSLNIIGTGTGNVSMTDVKTAAAGKAIVVGFDIGCDSGVQGQARHDGVRINSFRIIYELIDHVKNSMLDLLPPEYRELVKGHAEIKQIYDIGKLGKIAGSQMLDGSLVAKERFRILRGKERIWEGKVQTLRHFKDEVKEVSGQQECGVCFAGFEGFQPGDVIECYVLEELPKSL